MGLLLALLTVAPAEESVVPAQPAHDTTGGGGLYRQARGSIRIEDDDEIKDGFQRDTPLVRPTVVSEIKPPILANSALVDRFAPSLAPAPTLTLAPSLVFTPSLGPDPLVQAKRNDAALRILLLAA